MAWRCQQCRWRHKTAAIGKICEFIPASLARLVSFIDNCARKGVTIEKRIGNITAPAFCCVPFFVFIEGYSWSNLIS
jgi:hypothetical protein